MRTVANHNGKHYSTVCKKKRNFLINIRAERSIFFLCLIKIISKKHSKKNWKAENQALCGIIIENVKQTLKK